MRQLESLALEGLSEYGSGGDGYELFVCSPKGFVHRNLCVVPKKSKKTSLSPVFAIMLSELQLIVERKIIT